jgi:hypothetical protein
MCGIEPHVGVRDEADAMGALVDPDARRDGDLETTVDGRQLQLGSRREAEFVA